MFCMRILSFPAHSAKMERVDNRDQNSSSASFCYFFLFFFFFFEEINWKFDVMRNKWFISFFSVLFFSVNALDITVKSVLSVPKRN